MQTSASLPDTLRHWNIINGDDEGQVEEIWRHLRCSTVVINHFLNHFVLPGHARQLSVKLQASGCDVPLFSIKKETRVLIDAGVLFWRWVTGSWIKHGCSWILKPNGQSILDLIKRLGFNTGLAMQFH